MSIPATYAGFSEAGGRLGRRLPDPARGRGDVGAYLSQTASIGAKSKVKAALGWCERADSLREAGDDVAAMAIYRQVFGFAFPG